MTHRRRFGDSIDDNTMTSVTCFPNRHTTCYPTRLSLWERAMHIRHYCLLLVGLSALTSVHSQSVVDLPGVHASASTTCVQPTHGGSTTLSYDCLNQQLATPPGMPSPLDTNDVRKVPSNRLGLYNAAALGQRMGTNLGRSVQPYRPPTPTYPAALTH